MNGTVHNSEILIKLARGTSPSFDRDKVMFAPPRQLIRKWLKLALPQDMILAGSVPRR